VNSRAVDETDPSVQTGAPIRMVTYLPDEASPPLRTIIYGHGLGGDRFQAEALADAVVGEELAVVAIDAVNHGDHPHQGDSGMLTTITPIAGFFGLWANLGNGAIDWRVDGLQLRDNFRQSTYDKLQLIEVIRSGPDVDGDGVADLGMDGLSYLGVSLGGIMSAELAALAPEIEVVLPVVPGARLANIIKDSATFSMIVDVLRAGATDGEIATFFPILQTVIDRADPGAYLPHVIDNRLPGFDQDTPQVLMSMVLNDAVVPPSSNLFFGRCLGAPHVGEQLLPVGTIAHEPGLPVSGNIDPEHTAGLFQYDQVETTDGVLEPATHENVGRSTVFQLQAIHFLDSYLENGVAEIIDPYAELELK
jgi:cephalosporin-C deacetylase-like acetyl esterase